MFHIALNGEIDYLLILGGVFVFLQRHSINKHFAVTNGDSLSVYNFFNYSSIDEDSFYMATHVDLFDCHKS